MTTSRAQARAAQIKQTRELAVPYVKASDKLHRIAETIDVLGDRTPTYAITRIAQILREEDDAPDE